MPQLLLVLGASAGLHSNDGGPPLHARKAECWCGALATHPGRVKDRIVAAFNEGLYGVNPKALPPEAERMWNELYAKLTTAQDKERGSFAASLDFLDEDDARHIAKGGISFDGISAPA